MVDWNPTLKKAYWSLAGMGGVYVLFLLTLTIPPVQKNFVYLNRLRLPFVSDLTKGEQFGFAHNQVTPFNITNNDVTLFGWHILPPGVYATYRNEILQKQPHESGVIVDRNTWTSAKSFDILKNDPDSRVVVSFHGNVGTVGQGWRPDSYRNFYGAGPDNVHVIAFDYRGFGRSTGFPTEEGLISDGVTMLRFIINDIGISPSRIIAIGQSLGAAVSLGTTETLAREDKTELAGLILLAGFSDLKTLIMTYSMGGIIPILGPLKQYPWIQRKLQQYVVELWDSKARLASLIRHSPKLKLSILHSIDDMEINWQHSKYLYESAANTVYTIATEKKMAAEGSEAADGEKRAPLTEQEIENLSQKEDLGDEGIINRWTDSVPEGGWQIEQKVIRWGGHSQIVVAAPVQMTIRRLFGF